MTADQKIAALMILNDNVIKSGAPNPVTNTSSTNAAQEILNSHLNKILASETDKGRDSSTDNAVRANSLRRSSNTAQSSTRASVPVKIGSAKITLPSLDGRKGIGKPKQ
jgi:hypothetical protein